MLRWLVVASFVILAINVHHLRNDARRIAIVLPDEGVEALAAEDILAGAELARSWPTASHLEIHPWPDASDSLEVARLARRVVASHPLLVIGHYNSQETQIGAAEYQRRQIPLIAPAATANGLSGEWVFPLPPSNRQQAEAIVQHLTLICTHRRWVAVVAGEGQYSTDLATSLEIAAADSGSALTVVRSDQLMVLPSGSDACWTYVGYGTTAAGVIRQIRSQAPSAPIVLSDGVVGGSIGVLRLGLGPGLIDSISVAVPGGPSHEWCAEVGRAFADSFTTRFKRAPSVWAYRGFQALRIANEVGGPPARLLPLWPRSKAKERLQALWTADGSPEGVHDPGSGAYRIVRLSQIDHRGGLALCM